MTTSRKSQAGLTLIEFMVSIAIGMLLIAAIATLIANQSSTRADLDKSGRMIENGRYAVRVISEDALLAGYWGELATIDPPTMSPVDPCSTSSSAINDALALHVQGFDSSLTPPACVSNAILQPGTDVLVVRHANPDFTDVITGGAVDFTNKVKEGQVYLQTGLDATGLQFAKKLSVAKVTDANALFNAEDSAAFFSLKKKDRTTVAPLRKVQVHIYFVSKCSVEVSSNNCTNADGGSPIPTLKRLELTVDSDAPVFKKVTIAEGIENLQIDYGVDTDADGAPNGADQNGSTLTEANWPNVMTLKIHLLARTSESSVGYVDDKKYVMGTAGQVGPFNNAYKRHAFVQSVRLVNPIMRRAP